MLHATPAYCYWLGPPAYTFERGASKLTNATWACNICKHKRDEDGMYLCSTASIAIHSPMLSKHNSRFEGWVVQCWQAANQAVDLPHQLMRELLISWGEQERIEEGWVCTCVLKG